MFSFMPSVGSRSNVSSFSSVVPEKRFMALRRSKPHGSSKFKGSTFKVILRQVPTVPAVSIVPDVPDFPHRVMQRGVRRMDVFFSADDRQEYLDLLSQSASKHALDFLAGCLMSHHAHFVGCPSGEITRTHVPDKRIAIFREGWPVICGRSASILVARANGRVWGHS
jgi:hypothetical protein